MFTVRGEPPESGDSGIRDTLFVNRGNTTVRPGEIPDVQRSPLPVRFQVQQAGKVPGILQGVALYAALTRVSRMVLHWVHNPKRTGSIPAPATNSAVTVTGKLPHVRLDVETWMLDTESAREGWRAVEPLLGKAVSGAVQAAKGGPLPASFGIRAGDGAALSRRDAAVLGEESGCCSHAA